jgi:hypothetical protein
MNDYETLLPDAPVFGPLEPASIADYLGVPCGKHGVWRLCEALASLMWQSVRSADRLSPEDRDHLLRALAGAHASALQDLPAWIDRGRISLGFEGLAGLVCFWAADDAGRLARRPLLMEQATHARVFFDHLQSAERLDILAARQRRRLDIHQAQQRLAADQTEWKAAA